MHGPWEILSKVNIGNVGDGVKRVVGGAAQSAVSAYQNYISADYNRENGAKCAYTPSCSAYMRESVELLGVRQGVMDGLDRLSRCVPANLEKVHQNFYGQLSQSDPAEFASRFGFDPQDQELAGHLTKLKGLMSELGSLCSYPEARTFQEHLALMSPTQQKQALKVRDAVGDIMRDRIDVMGEDLPGKDPSIQSRIFVRRHFEIPPAPEPKGLLKACAATARFVGAAIGGLAASLPLALMGAALGGLKGAESGGGLEPSSNFVVNKTAVEKLVHLHQAVTDRIHNETLQKVVGVPLGGAVGAALGVAGGLRKAWTVAAKMTGLLAKNVTLQLGGMHPAGCNCGCNQINEVQQARLHPSQLHPSKDEGIQGIASKKWTVLAHMDATDIQLEPAITGHVIDMERALSSDSDTHLIVELRRKGLSPEDAQRASFRTRCLLPAVVVASGIASIPLLGLAPWKALKRTLFSAGNLYWLANRQQIRADQAEKAHDERSWKGTRTYEIGSNSIDKPGHLSIQTNVAHAKGKVRAEKATDLGAGWLKNFKKYPSEFQAVVLGGHGLGYKRVCGMDYREVAKALSVTSEGLGKKLDVVVLEACQSATIEGLNNLAPYARYAIASQENVGVAGFPWGHLIEHFADQDKEAPGQKIDRDPSTLASKWVRRYGAGGNPNLPTLTLVDLEKLPKVVEAVEQLAQELADKPEQVKLLSQVGGEVRAFPHLGPIELDGKLGKVEKLWKQFKRKTTEKPKLGDLGNLAFGLMNQTQDPKLKECCQAVIDKLGEAIVVHRSEQEGSSGLSIQMPQWKLFANEYERRSGMENWGDMLSKSRSWPNRLWTWTVGAAHEAVATVIPPVRRLGLLDDI